MHARLHACMFLMPAQAFAQAFPASSEMLVNLTSNFDHWSAMEATSSAAAAADAAAAGGMATAVAAAVVVASPLGCTQRD